LFTLFSAAVALATMEFLLELNLSFASLTLTPVVTTFSLLPPPPPATFKLTLVFAPSVVTTFTVGGVGVVALTFTVTPCCCSSFPFVAGANNPELLFSCLALISANTFDPTVDTPNFCTVGDFCPSTTDMDMVETSSGEPDLWLPLGFSRQSVDFERGTSTAPESRDSLLAIEHESNDPGDVDRLSAPASALKVREE
jgi:hypothetical protein